jgi:hypothetical protein
MTTRDDYTNEEWKFLRAAPMLAGMYVAMASRSGPVDSMKELAAISQAMDEGMRGSTGIEILDDVFADMKPRQGELVQTHDSVVINVKTPEQLKVATLDSCNKAARALEKASVEEAEGYKRWIVTLTQKVAEAGKEGGFLGIGGVLVSKEEESAINEISSALGLAA